MAFVVYFLQFFPVETQCLRLGLHPRLPLCLKSFKKEIQGTKMSGNETQENEMPKDETQGSEIQGNETQALRLYKCDCPKSQFLLLNKKTQ